MALLRAWEGTAPVVRQGAAATRDAFLSISRLCVLVASTHGAFHADAQPRLEAAGGSTRSPIHTGPPPTPEQIALESPLAWGRLVFAGANVEANGRKGFVSGLDVLGMDLQGTELVVLSACETGLGTVANGQGVMGLRYAFRIAGAHTVTASLWRVPDDSTVALMTAYFEELSRGRSSAEALVLAQRTFIARQRESGELHPFEWAAFTSTGAP